MKTFSTFISSVLITAHVIAAGAENEAHITRVADSNRWALSPAGHGITWSVDHRLPHKDHVAMSGKSVDAIIEWALNSQGYLAVRRVIRWPMLRTIPDDTHASLSRPFDTEDWKKVLLDNQPASEPVVRRVQFDGVLRFDAAVGERLAITRVIFPCVHLPVLLDRISVKNLGNSELHLRIPENRDESFTDPASGTFGAYRVVRQTIGSGTFCLAPGESVSWIVSHAAVRQDEPLP